MDEGVHVRGGQIVDFIPVSRGQHHVGIDAGRAHAEFRHHHEVQLALFHGRITLEFARLHRGFPAAHGVFRAQKVAQEVLVPLDVGAQRVGAPETHDARHVVFVRRSLDGHAQVAGLQARHGVLDDFLVAGRAVGFSLAADLQGIFLELRIKRQPAQARGHGVAVRRVVGQSAFPAGRAHAPHVQQFVAPGVNSEIVEGGAVLQARRPGPVPGHGHRGPAGERAHLFLAHIMGPAAAVDALAAAERGQGKNAAVDDVVVVPVVDARAHDDHGAAVRGGGIVREAAGHLDDLFARHAGERFLPGRGAVDPGVVVIAGHVAAVPPVHAQASGQQLKDRGHAARALGRLQGDVRHGTQFDGGLSRVENRKGRHGPLSSGGFFHTQQRRQFGLVGLVAHVQIPAAVLAVARAHAAHGHGRAVARDVVDHGFPFRIVALAPDVRSAHKTAGSMLIVRAVQEDKAGQVGEAPGVILEIGNAAV